MANSKPESPRCNAGDGAAPDDLVKPCPPSCPDVSFFEGCKTRANYFGFDHKTNLVETAGTDEYWLPTPERGTLTMPTARETRDGARWVSVAVDKETEVEIDFAFKKTECAPCIANCKYEVSPATIAEVVTTKVTAQKAAFKIKGKAEGEASLKVICDGADIGWFHIWSKNEATIKVDVVNLVTTQVAVDAYDLALLTAAFEDIFRQAAIKVDMISLGDLDLSKDAALAKTEARGYSAAGEFLARAGTPSPYSFKSAVLTALDAKATAALSARKVAPLPRSGAYRIYRYVPTGGCGIAGTVLNIGSSPAFTFMSDEAAARNSIAHEFGHCLGLRHPSDSASTAQYAAHNLASKNKAIPDYDATNTEPATAAAAAEENVMANDPTNLMGYWDDKANRKPIRYHQWKACSRS